MVRGLLRSFLRIKEYDGMNASILMAVLLILFSAFAAIMRNAYFWNVATAGVKLRVALGGLIFKKVHLHVTGC